VNEKLLSNIRIYFAQSVFNSKCHFKAYDRLIGKKKHLSLFIKIISGFTLFVLILQNIGLQNQIPILVHILSVSAMVLTGISLSFEIFNKDDISQSISQQKKYGEKYKILRDKYMSFIEEVMSNALTDEQMREKRDELQKIYNELGEDSPQTTPKDYEKAQIALKNNEEFTWSDKEIDRFLPEHLHFKVDI
jgi:hypothetical protein